jgi:hypothetical protein
MNRFITILGALALAGCSTMGPVGSSAPNLGASTAPGNARSPAAYNDPNFVSQPDLQGAGIQDADMVKDLMAVQFDRIDPWIKLSATSEVRTLLTHMQKANADVRFEDLAGKWKCRTLLDGKYLYDYFDCEFTQTGATMRFDKLTGSQPVTGSVQKISGENPAVLMLGRNDGATSGVGMVYAESKSRIYVIVKEGFANRVLELVRN